MDNYRELLEALETVRRGTETFGEQTDAFLTEFSIGSTANSARADVTKLSKLIDTYRKSINKASSNLPLLRLLLNQLLAKIDAYANTLRVYRDHNEEILGTSRGSSSRSPYKQMVRETRDIYDEGLRVYIQFRRALAQTQTHTIGRRQAPPPSYSSRSESGGRL